MSGWSEMLAAAFCPHMTQAHSCCLTSAAHVDNRVSPPNTMKTVGMCGMEMMSDMNPGANPGTNIANEVTNTIGQPFDQLASSQPITSCMHCMGRSNLLIPPTALLSGTVAQSKTIIDVALTTACNPIATFAPIFTLPPRSRPNVPPGVSVPRHVLINIFRI